MVTSGFRLGGAGQRTVTHTHVLVPSQVVYVDGLRTEDLGDVRPPNREVNDTIDRRHRRRSTDLRRSSLLPKDGGRRGPDLSTNSKTGKEF